MAPKKMQTYHGVAVFELPISRDETVPEKVQDLIKGLPQNVKVTPRKHSKSLRRDDTLQVLLPVSYGPAKGAGRADLERKLDTLVYDGTIEVHEA